MKRLIALITIIFCFSLSKISAQIEKKDSMQYFIVLYTIGEAWDTTKQFYEQKYFDDHSNFLSKLRKEKTIITGGRYSDTGMIILQSKDERTALLIMDADVSVKNKVFQFELYPLDIFYSGCLEEP